MCVVLAVIQVIQIPFRGCVKDIQIQTRQSPDEWAPLDWSRVVERVGSMPEWEGCPMGLTEGVHFPGQGTSVTVIMVMVTTTIVI